MKSDLTRSIQSIHYIAASTWCVLAAPRILLAKFENVMLREETRSVRDPCISLVLNSLHIILDLHRKFLEEVMFENDKQRKQQPKS
jgi:hypothetical protein